MSELSCSRGLPAAHVRRLEEVMAAPKTFDGRSIKWVENLAETQFIEFRLTKEKAKTTIEVSITERGLTALERNRRGVDPYLVMT